jgi:hypothetical protein
MPSPDLAAYAAPDDGLVHLVAWTTPLGWRPMCGVERLPYVNARTGATIWNDAGVAEDRDGHPVANPCPRCQAHPLVRGAAS